jgi:hypothetical protein
MTDASGPSVTVPAAAEPSSPLEQTISLLGSRISGLIGPSETELSKWKRVFDSFAAPVEGSEQKYAPAFIPSSPILLRTQAPPPV